MMTDDELAKIFVEQGEPDETGDLLPLPSMPLLEMKPPPGESVGASIMSGETEMQETGEAPMPDPTIPDIRLGMKVQLPNGEESRVQWIDPRRQRVGVGKRKRNMQFFHFTQVKDISSAPIVRELDKDRRKDAEEQQAPPPPPARMPATLPKGLMAHQLESIEFVYQHGGRAIIADEMGLGKTASAIASFEGLTTVVCPSLLKVNWGNEITKWAPNKSFAIIDGSDPDTVDAAARRADVVIINYDILYKHIGWLMERKNHTVVADEAHYLKTLDVRWNKTTRQHEVAKNTSRRAESFYNLQKSAARLLLLTGTPVLNRVRELFPLLHMLDPKRWGSFYKFCMDYCAGNYQYISARMGDRLNCDGRSNSRELHEILVDNYMIRHTKEAVLTQLPAKSRNTIMVSMPPDEQRNYNHVRNNFMDWVKKNGGADAVMRAQKAQVLVQLNKLRAAAAVGKAQAALHHIVNFFVSTQRPLVVFALHTELFDRLESGLKQINDSYKNAKRAKKPPPIPRPIRFASILGGMSDSKRQKAITDFQQKGEIDVLFYSIPIATGTTLTRGQDALFLERMWRPGDMVQAEDRLHRIGQRNAVGITYMDAEGTIDAKMGLLLANKSQAFSAVIDGVELDTQEANMLVFGDMLAEIGLTLTGDSLADLLGSAAEGDPIDIERNPSTSEPDAPFGEDTIEDPYIVAAIQGSMRRNAGAAAPLMEPDGEFVDDFGDPPEDTDQYDEFVSSSWHSPL